MVATLQRWGSALLGTSTARQLAADQAGQRFTRIESRYELLSSYYHNEMYDVANAATRAIKSQAGLYRNIRPIRNPMRRAIDWYPGKLYPGAMTADGMPLPDGTPSCLPFASDTKPEIRLAFTQAFEWANFGSLRWQFGRGLPMLGDQFGEVHVDYERRKVYPVLHFPGYVIDAEWNGSGDLIMYRLKIPMVEPATGLAYSWGKRVDREKITTYYNDQEQGFDGQPAVIPNPWGFAPAAWCQFRNIGGQHGAALADGVRFKIDEVNSSLSSIHDYIGKFVNQGVIISAEGGKQGFIDAMAVKKTASQVYDSLTNPNAGRDELPYLFVPPGTQFERAMINLGLGESDSHINRLIAEIDADLPESTMDDHIRQHPQIAGVALRMMFGDAETRLFETQGNADNFWITLGQMCLTIGGELARNGDWGLRSQLTEAQQTFLPFTLQSYDRGETNVMFNARPIFTETADERIARAKARESLETATGLAESGYDQEQIAALLRERKLAHAADDAVLWNQAGMPLTSILREIGFDEAKITAVMADKAANVERARQAFDAGEPILPADSQAVA